MPFFLRAPAIFMIDKESMPTSIKFSSKLTLACFLGKDEIIIDPMSILSLFPNTVNSFAKLLLFLLKTLLISNFVSND